MLRICTRPPKGFDWLAELFATSKQNISQHIASILKENELDANSVVKDYFTTASDGKEYKVTFYSLDMILAIGFRVKSKRGTQFRIWANRNLKEYMVKGFVMDDARLENRLRATKNLGNVLLVLHVFYILLCSMY